MKPFSNLHSFPGTSSTTVGEAGRPNEVAPGRCSKSARLLALATGAVLALGALTLSARAQDADSAPPPPPDAGPATPPPEARANRMRGNYNPETMMAALRKRLEVTDDAEWNLISTRIAAVRTLQRSAGGFGGMRGGSPEQQALREAVTDKLPDAEIKARLARVRAVRKDNEAKLSQARADLAAVLTVRQEAALVLMGLLP
jgi:Spy/CpxP family protein refolding chaperone